MPPIPCAHCGFNFMRRGIDPLEEKLCNNCSLREEIRNPKKGEQVETVDILIKCPRDIQIDIEEICINKGIDFSKYFLLLHESNHKITIVESESNKSSIKPKYKKGE